MEGPQKEPEQQMKGVLKKKIKKYFLNFGKVPEEEFGIWGGG